LSETPLAELPAEIGNLSNLEELILSDTKITALPPEIGRLSALRKLDLSGSFISSLPLELFDLPHLEELNLRATGITALPAEISRLTRLTKLDLSYISLVELPEELLMLKLNFTTGGNGIVVDHLQLPSQEALNQLLARKVQPFAYLPSPPLTTNPGRFLFRGFEKEREIWTLGYPDLRDGVWWITPGGGQNANVVWPETVGQSSGYRDSKGTLIFEGDILATVDGAPIAGRGEESEQEPGLVSFHDGAFYITMEETSILLASWLEGNLSRAEIISSIFAEDASRLCPWLHLDPGAWIRK
jgi:hypothetical protein